MPPELIQDRDRPEAPLASAPSVNSQTFAPRRARWYALETPTDAAADDRDPEL
jgi:hypothetical protein